MPHMSAPVIGKLGIQIMKLLVLFFSAIFFSSQLLACFGPIQGDEFDSLIEIEKLGKNHYSYEFPSEVHGYKNNGSVTLAYSQKERGPIMVDTPHIELFPIEMEGVMRGEFFIPEKENSAFLIVSWPPKEECCLCAFLAFSNVVNRQ